MQSSSTEGVEEKATPQRRIENLLEGLRGTLESINANLQESGATYGQVLKIFEEINADFRKMYEPPTTQEEDSSKPSDGSGESSISA